MIKVLRKLRAKLNNTFSVDCPRCHKHYYGYQGHKEQVKVKNQDGKMIHYRYVCFRCTKDEHKTV